MRWLSITALAFLAACNSSDPSPKPTGDAEAETAPLTSQTTPPGPEETADTATAIPALMQGRWGLVAADCEAGRADAKGLMVVKADSLEFYESMATLDRIDESAASSIRAQFNFTGEGMSWEREMILELQDGGNMLVQRELGSEASPGPLEYARCS